MRSNIGEQESLAWNDERGRDAELGRNLRLAQAECQGVAGARSRTLLTRISELERNEYTGSHDARLTDAQRLELWRHRAELAGRSDAGDPRLGPRTRPSCCSTGTG